MKSKPPAYLKFVPAIFIFICALAAYVATEFALQNIGAIQGAGPFNKVIEDVKETIDEIKSVVEEFKKPIEGKKKEKRQARTERQSAPARMKRPTLDQLSKEPLVIAEFGEESQLFDLSLMQSKGYKGSFAVDKSQLDKYGRFPVLLEADNVGESSRAGFVTGVINFRKSVKIGKMQAIEITVRGSGIKSFGFSILKSDERDWIGWDIQNVKAPKGWTTITRPFVDFEYWSYDMKKLKYNKGVEWAPPKKIDSVRFYLQVRHLDDRKNGKLWVSKVALR